MKFFRKAGAVLAAAAAIALAPSLFADEHWELQYQYRQVDSTLTLNDLTFPDQTHGIACGFTTDRKGKDHPIVLLTSDGGQNWSETQVKETCLSLFFLPDASGWMVTDNGVWSSEESGRAWTKLKSSPANTLRLWFVDHQHGFAAGRQKHVWETKDGGATWTAVEEAANAPGDAVYTTYGDISFSGLKGMVAGWDIPPQRGGPDWMNPVNAKSARQVPHVSILLQTKDGGVTWKENHVSLFGQITRISMNSLDMALGLVEFKDQFDYPSEVYRIDMSTGKNELTFRAKDRAITDIRLFPQSTRALLVGYEAAGPIFRSPIPGKLKVLASDDMQNWKPIDVDYRAVARSALLTGPDDKHVWIATDTGMILHLAE